MSLLFIWPQSIPLKTGDFGYLAYNGCMPYEQFLCQWVILVGDRVVLSGFSSPYPFNPLYEVTIEVHEILYNENVFPSRFLSKKNSLTFVTGSKIQFRLCPH